MTNTSPFQLAIRTALEPWSSVDQKLGALSYLESIETPESMQVLRQAMEMFGLYINEKDRYDPNLPKAGEVAGAAALSLGRLEELGGLRELLKIVLSGEESDLLRECAAYGLGGLVSAEVFQAYEKAILIQNKLIHKMVLKSIRQSYARLDNVPTQASEEFLITLFSYLLESSSHIEADSIEEICQIIALNVDSKHELELTNLVKSNLKDFSGFYAVKILLNRGKQSTIQTIGLVLEEYGALARIYDLLAVKLGASSDERIKTAAKNAISNYPAWRKFLYLFSKVERESRDSQLSAAKHILYVSFRTAQ